MTKKPPKRDWTVKAVLKQGATSPLIDLTYRFANVETRRLTVHPAVIGVSEYQNQKFFLDLLGAIWWDMSYPDSYVRTTHVADEMLRVSRAALRESTDVDLVDPTTTESDK